MSEQWVYLTEDGGLCEDGAGWYVDGVYETKATRTFEPGEGFMLYSQIEGEGAGLNFKPLLVK